MKIYIANSTRHHHRFFYTLAEQSQRYQVEIRSGGQAVIPQDLSHDQADRVVGQLERYGARDVREVTEHMPNYSGLSYHVDRTVSEEQILIGHEAVVENAEIRSVEEVAKVAAGVDIFGRDGDNIRQKMGGRRKGKVTELSIVQESGDPNMSEADKVKTTFQVTPDAREGSFRVRR